MARHALVAVLLVGACRGGAGASSADGAAPAQSVADANVGLSTVPVTVASARVADIPVIVSGPGRTESTETQQIRAPFDGVLLDLVVADGDHVRSGQVLGWFVSRDTEAALAGARAMLREARTSAQRHDARSALKLAERGLVKARLTAPEAGIVLSHQADEGARLTANQVIVTIVASDSVVFVAQIAQRDLADVHSGEAATIALAAEAAAKCGRVHTVLPGGSATDLTAPVRIDFCRNRPREINLFGVARIRVATRPAALVVPASAVLRDDITGVSRVATVDATDRVHWTEVHVGLTYGGEVEIVSPPLPPDTRVVVSGLVGLPEGAHVKVRA